VLILELVVCHLLARYLMAEYYLLAQNQLVCNQQRIPTRIYQLNWDLFGSAHTSHRRATRLDQMIRRSDSLVY
jgi:hypothetical protein